VEERFGAGEREAGGGLSGGSRRRGVHGQRDSFTMERHIGDTSETHRRITNSHECIRTKRDAERLVSCVSREQDRQTRRVRKIPRYPDQGMCEYTMSHHCLQHS